MLTSPADKSVEKVMKGFGQDEVDPELMELHFVASKEVELLNDDKFASVNKDFDMKENDEFASVDEDFDIKADDDPIWKKTRNF